MRVNVVLVGAGLYAVCLCGSFSWPYQPCHSLHSTFFFYKVPSSNHDPSYDLYPHLFLGYAIQHIEDSYWK